MIEIIIIGLFLFLSILFSGFFIWIGLRLVGRKRNIIEASLANLAASVFAFIVMLIFSAIPLIGMLSPVISYLAYIYSLKVILRIQFFEAFLVSIVAVIIFTVFSIVISLFFGIWLLKYAFIKPFFKPFPIHF